MAGSSGIAAVARWRPRHLPCNRDTPPDRHAAPHSWGQTGAPPGSSSQPAGTDGSPCRWCRSRKQLGVVRVSLEFFEKRGRLLISHCFHLFHGRHRVALGQFGACGRRGLLSHGDMWARRTAQEVSNDQTHEQATDSHSIRLPGGPGVFDEKFFRKICHCNRP